MCEDEKYEMLEDASKEQLLSTDWEYMLNYMQSELTEAGELINHIQQTLINYGWDVSYNETIELIKELS